MSIDKEGAELIAAAVGQHIRQVLQPIEAMTKTIERLADKISEVDRRVVHLEASNRSADIERLFGQLTRAEAELSNDIRDLRRELSSDHGELKDDVEALMEWRNRMSGAAALFNGVKAWAPIIATGLFVAFTYFTLTGALPK